MPGDEEGFTLLELVIVVVIIGVLTSLALPRFFNVIENARTSEAIATIATIRSGMERCYLMNNASYAGCNAKTTGEGWALLGMSNPTDAPGSHFRYRTSSNYPDAFLICASRKMDYNPVFDSDCYFLCLGLGVKATMDAGGASHCSAAYDWRRDGKFYWASENRVSGFLPKTD